jgi:CRP-like cAMP-binding protein
VTGRKRDWRKLVAALLVAGVVVGGAQPAVADGGSTSALRTLTTQFPLGDQKLCCRNHSRARSLQRDSAGSATGQGGRAAWGTSVVFVGSVALLALLVFLELSAAFRAPNIGRPSRASRILETVRHRAWLIDRIRHDIQERLEQLVAEAEKLRRALAALYPRENPNPNSTPKPTRKLTPKPAERSAPAAHRTPEPPAAAPQGAPSSGKASPRARAAPGATKATVLGALSTDRAMTAGDVAKATGLARGTVSTTLTKLAKTGEVSKAERGYRLPARH